MTHLNESNKHDFMSASNKHYYKVAVPTLFAVRLSTSCIAWRIVGTQ